MWLKILEKKRDCILILVTVQCRIKDMYYHFNERSGQKAPLIADDVYEIIMKVIILPFLLSNRQGCGLCILKFCLYYMFASAIIIAILFFTFSVLINH
jgi:hypothetical protein